MLAREDGVTDASGEVTGSSGAAQRVLVRAATALVTSAALLAPGPLVGQAACTTEEGPMVEEMRETYREIAELRDSVEAILDREDALDSVGKILVVTDLDRMETDIGFVDWRGQVAEVRFQDSSGDEWLDEAFAATAREMEFEPATVEGTPIGVWVTRELTINAR